MSSDQEVNIFVPNRVSNKLTLDSEQQERKQQQQRQRLQQVNKKKQQRRKRKEQAEKAELQRLRLQQERQKKYGQPQMMFQQDSEDGNQFKRVTKKIKKMYPQHINKNEVQSKNKRDFIVQDSDDDQQSQSDSDSGSNSSDGSRPKQQNQHRTPKKQKKIEKKQKVPEKRVQKRPVQKKRVQVTVKKQKIKLEEKEGGKQHLVQQVSKRWWYALPEWPPVGFDYEGKLKNLGYRAINAQNFRIEDDIVNGLQKVVAVDGYKGVYKSKTGLIFARPNQSAPTLNNFRSMSIEQLTDILKKALTLQIQQLKQVKYEQKGEAVILLQLQRLQKCYK